MLTKQGVALTFYAFFVASKQGKSGLTTTVDIYETTSGTPIVSAASATELGGGLYYYTLSAGSVDDSGGYVAVFKTADSSVDQQHIPALWITDTELKNLDAAISTRSTLTAAQANAEADTALADAGVTTTVTGRIDAAVSSRAAAVDWTPQRAALVDYLDAAISSRLAAAGYTAPLDAGATQTAAETGAGQALAIYTAATAADVAAAAGLVWEETAADHATAGTTGAALAAAGSAGDPLTNTVPGAYLPGTAGYILGSINPAQVTVTSPVATDGTSITIVRGDDYLNTDGRALTFTGATWPTLTAGTVALIVDINGTPTSYTGVITGAGECYVELTDTQTSALTPGAYNYDLQATLDNVTTSIVTLVQGLLLVSADVR